MSDEKDIKRIAAAIYQMPEPEWKKELITNEKGVPRALLANAVACFRHAPGMQNVLSYNTLNLGIVIARPTPWETTGDWTDFDSSQAAVWLQGQHGIHVPSSVAAEAAVIVSRDRSFHPVRRYLDSLVWDGTDRTNQWLSLYLGTENSPYTQAVGERWLISAVARVEQPGVKADTCLIAEGRQGTFKSTAFRILGGEWFTDDLAEMGSKDSAMQCHGSWIVELPELDSLSRAEISKVKAFMSRAVDRFRPPYARAVVEYKRQCVFGGTVNHSAYLRDPSGARRFWPVACSTIRIEELARDRDQIWAQAVAKYKSGAAWWLDTDELNLAAESEQAKRYEEDPWAEEISTYLLSHDEVSIAEILRHLDKPEAQWTRTDQMRVAAFLQSQGWDKFRDRVGTHRRYMYRRSQ